MIVWAIKKDELYYSAVKDEFSGMDFNTTTMYSSRERALKVAKDIYNCNVDYAVKVVKLKVDEVDESQVYVVRDRQGKYLEGEKLVWNEKEAYALRFRLRTGRCWAMLSDLLDRHGIDIKKDVELIEV